MNKRTKISLILVITLVLLLGLTVPSLAKQNPKYSCYIYPLIEDKDEEILSFFLMLFGDLEVAGWVDGTLVNKCTGTVPFGEAIMPAFSYAEFDAYCKEELGKCNEGETIYTWSPDSPGTIYDPDARVYYPTSYRLFTLKNNGEFTYYKEYTPLNP